MLIFLFQTIEEKTTLTLKVKVVGQPAPTLKWFRDTTELKPTFKNKITHDGDDWTLTIPGVTKVMSGVYKVVATNTFGEVEHAAQITVCEKMVPAKFTLKPMNKEVKEGQPIKLLSQAKGTPKPDITAFKDDEPITLDAHVKLDFKDVRGEVHAVLSIDDSTPDDAATYKFIAKNPAGEDSCFANISVKGKSLINYFCNDTETIYYVFL